MWATTKSLAKRLASVQEREQCQELVNELSRRRRSGIEVILTYVRSILPRIEHEDFVQYHVRIALDAIGNAKRDAEFAVPTIRSLYFKADPSKFPVSEQCIRTLFQINTQSGIQFVSDRLDGLNSSKRARSEFKLIMDLIFQETSLIRPKVHEDIGSFIPALSRFVSGLPNSRFSPAVRDRIRWRIARGLCQYTTRHGSVTWLDDEKLNSLAPGFPDCPLTEARAEQRRQMKDDSDAADKRNEAWLDPDRWR